MKSKIAFLLLGKSEEELLMKINYCDRCKTWYKSICENCTLLSLHPEDIDRIIDETIKEDPWIFDGPLDIKERLIS